MDDRIDVAQRVQNRSRLERTLHRDDAGAARREVLDKMAPDESGGARDRHAPRHIAFS
jgi:hypothetical protein